MQGHKSVAQSECESNSNCVSHSDWNVFWAYFQQVSERFTVSWRNRQWRTLASDRPTLNLNLYLYLSLWFSDSLSRGGRWLFNWLKWEIVTICVRRLCEWFSTRIWFHNYILTYICVYMYMCEASAKGVVGMRPEVNVHSPLFGIIMTSERCFL